VENTIPNFQKLAQLLNQKIYSSKFIVGVPYHNIKQWKNASLLLDTPAKNEWNKFSLTDILWIGIIIELKNFGFTNDKIIKIKEELFKPNESLLNHSQNVSNINAATIEVITYSHPIFFVLDVVGNLEIIDGYRTIEKLKDGEITDHLILSVNEFFKKNIEALFNEPNFDIFKGLNKDEIQMILIMRSQKFESIKITKKDGKIYTIEATEKMEANYADVLDILKQHEYQSVEMVLVKGKIVKFHRTIKSKAQTTKK
jgi:DNA-binding transcriptional MerR regulator